MFKKRKVFPDFGFINKVEKLITLDFLFTEDGVVEISNNLGDTMTVDVGDGFDVWSGVQVFDEDTKVTQRWFITDKTGKTVAEIYIIYDFVALPNRVKITIEGKLDRERTIKIPFKNIEREFYFDDKRLILWGCRRKDPADEFFYGIGFEFSDIAKAGLSWKLDEKERVLYIDVPKHFKIDPTTVGLTTSGYATRVTTQRKTFYANGRYWVFYGDGTNIVYRTSTDALTWTDATVIRAGDGREFSVWFDGTYLHYVYAPFDGTNIYYRMGTPNADGTITWLATEQSLGIAYRCRYPTITTDSNGYPWVGWEEYNPAIPAYYAKVSKSATKDGTWTHDTNFPHTLHYNTLGYYYAVALAPLSGGRMWAVWSRVNDRIRGKEWSGTEWYPTETLTDSIINYYDPYCFSITTDPEDSLHLVYKERTDNEIRYVKRPATTTTQKSPHFNYGAWSDGANAYASNNLYASSPSKDQEHEWFGYDYSGIPVGATIRRVEVGLEIFGDGNDTVEVYSSGDGGLTWNFEMVYTPPSSDPNSVYWIVITKYNRSQLQSPNFIIKLIHKAVGKVGTMYLDWIPTRVTYGPPPSETVLATVGTMLDTFPTICVDESTGDLYVFWDYNHHLFYRKYDKATDTWEPTVDWITEYYIVTNAQPCYWKMMNDHIGIIWFGNPTQTPPPLYVRHETLPPPVVPVRVLGDSIVWIVG